MKPETARELGAKAGRDEVNEIYNEQGVDVLRECQRPGHLDWDEGAINAQCHAVDDVPDELRDVYYTAYNDAANELANRYIAKHDSSVEAARNVFQKFVDEEDGQS